MDKNKLQLLAIEATSCLLKQVPMVISLHDKEPRNGFPLPMKKALADEAGMITQNYRPMAILEYVNDVLSGEIAKRNAKARRKARRKEMATGETE